MDKYYYDGNLGVLTEAGIKKFESAGKPYSVAVDETKLQNTTNVRNSITKFKLNGEIFTFEDARLIDGDTNYLQLREFAQKLSGTSSQFNVYWDSVAGKAVCLPIQK